MSIGTKRQECPWWPWAPGRRDLEVSAEEQERPMLVSVCRGGGPGAVDSEPTDKEARPCLRGDLLVSPGSCEVGSRGAVDLTRSHLPGARLARDMVWHWVLSSESTAPSSPVDPSKPRAFPFPSCCPN